MSYLHSEKIIHRDMNLGNFLLSSNWTLKISDFGATKILTQNNSKHTITPGAPYYLSPEVRSGYYSFSCDVWSFGLIVSDLCALQSLPDPPNPPFDQIDNEFNRLFASCGDEDGKRVLFWKQSPIFSTLHLLEYLLRRDQALEMIKKYSSTLEKMIVPCLYFEISKIKMRPSFEELKDKLIEFLQSTEWDNQMPSNTVQQLLE